jgi:hypothetical protein
MMASIKQRNRTHMRQNENNQIISSKNTGSDRKMVKISSLSSQLHFCSWPVILSECNLYCFIGVALF